MQAKRYAPHDPARTRYFQTQMKLAEYFLQLISTGGKKNDIQYDDGQR